MFPLAYPFTILLNYNILIGFILTNNSIVPGFFQIRKAFVRPNSVIHGIQLDGESVSHLFHNENTEKI